MVRFGLLWAVLLFQSPFRWCCLPSPSLGGAAWFLPSLDGVDVFLHLFGGTAFLPLPLGSGAFSPLVCCFSSPLVVLPSSPSCGWSCFFPSSVGWCCLVSSSFGRCCFSSLLLCAAAFLLLLWVGLLSPRLQLGGAWSTRVVLRCFFSFAWCCLSHPPFGGAAFPPGWCCWVFLLWVVLLFFLLLFVVLPSFSSFGWSCIFHLFCWVVLLGLLLLLGGVAVQNQKEKLQSKEKFENSGKGEK